MKLDARQKKLGTVFAAAVAAAAAAGQTCSACSDASEVRGFVGRHRWVPPNPYLIGNRLPVNPNVVDYLLDDADWNTFQAARDAGFVPDIESFLIDGGTMFLNFILSNPWCCPSRATEMCGLHAHNNGTYHNQTGLSSWQNWESANESLAENLFARGYYVGRSGKGLNGATSINQTPMRGYHWWRFLLNETNSFNHFGYSHRHCTLPTGTGVSCSGSSEYVTVAHGGAHQTDRTIQHATEFITGIDALGANVGAAPEPFVLFLSPPIPHVEHRAPGSYDTRHTVRQFRSRAPTRHQGTAREPGGGANGLIPLGGLGGPLDLKACQGAGTGTFGVIPTNASEWKTAGPNNEGATPAIIDGCASVALGTPTASTGADLRSMHMDVVEQWRGINDQVKQLKIDLEARGVLDSTIVCLRSDNGYLFGEHGDTLKMSYFQESIRVPMICRGPGIRKGQVRTELVSNIDLATTFVELTGGGTSYVTDGRSLVPLLRGTTPVSWRDRVLIEHWYADRSLPMDEWDMPDYVAILTGPTHQYPNMKYVEFFSTGAAPYSCGAQNTPPQTNTTRCGTPELYDLGNDPFEKVNQQGNGAYAAAKAQLATELEALRTCKPSGGTTCQSVEG